ncbi:MAG: hypothetical protein MAG795_00272 [Candidatus Woesearchaeota archaeon]|nr:hypothetical protein [Candidatus Woesearchaeota archaeon]
MPGVLIHTIAAIICLTVVHLLHYKWEYSLSIFAGNFVPDVIKFGFSAIKQGTLAIFKLKQDFFYNKLASTTSNPANWFTLGFFVLGICLLLYHFHYIEKKKMEEYDELYVFFLIGIIIHLILDALIMEAGYWF